MNRARGLLIFAGLLLAGFLALGLSGGRREPGQDGNGLRIAYAVSPKSLDPVEIDGTYAEGVARRIFNWLVRYDRNLKLVPDLAEEWKISDDGRTYTFALRSGVLFHHRRPMAAADVVWSLDRLANPAVSRQFGLLANVEGAAERWRLFKAAGAPDGFRPPPLAGLAAPDDRTVVIRLARPQAEFLNVLAMAPAAVLPRDVAERSGRDFARRPVGTGPFTLADWSDANRLVLRRFPDHFAGTPRLAAVTYRVIEEPAVRFQAYVRGDLDVTDVPLARLPEVSRWADCRSWPELDTFFLGISFTKEPCAGNVHLRRALNYAVDRERLCRVILKGAARPAGGVLPPGVPGYRAELQGYAFDPAACRRELSAAGFPEGRGLPALELYCKDDEDSRTMALELQQQFRRAGLPVEIRTVEQNLLKSLTARDPPPLFRWSWVADYPAPENFLQSCFHSSARGASNRVHYASPETDALLDAAAALPPGSARLAAFARAEEKIVADAPWVFLYHRRAHLLVKPEVHGLYFTGLDAGPELPQADFLNVWKEPE